MINKYNENVNTRINKEGIKVIYSIEYTEKDEDILPDFSNVKKVKNVKDLEQLIAGVIKLKMLGKYNITAYYIIEETKGDNWLLEDICTGIEGIKLEKDTRIEMRQREVIRSQEEELELYREFMREYKATEIYEQWKKNKNIKEAI